MKNTGLLLYFMVALLVILWDGDAYREACGKSKPFWDKIATGFFWPVTLAESFVEFRYGDQPKFSACDEEEKDG